ncbi:MAG: hypothetical protein ACXWL2_00590 [Candidatus Chromulinivorax sp.]
MNYIFLLFIFFVNFIISMDESFDDQICLSLSNHQLEMNKVDIFHEKFTDQEKDIFKTQESIQAFNQEEKELFALFGLKSDPLPNQIDKITQKKIRDRESQQKYRNQIKSVVKKIEEYDVDLFKEWQKEISQETIALDHVEKIMSYHEKNLGQDYIFLEKKLIKKSLISFCKDAILRKKYKMKKNHK